ncbi:hypothetical protein A9G07_10070 [Gilliamella sp. wkB72]|uniref:TrbG/VirB9 family P-type conjugative transfer protein n=1 Tax=Gilliamella sp. wkB72 TaxID=3120265 RepID=UPI000810324C|nr:TrbG/VirB9 family P-type conjugative transfer protein [Gilliamella apicola]OCL19317.1 hypothetical protein A9G07_10070 [Gilliamella apicola]
MSKLNKYKYLICPLIFCISVSVFAEINPQRTRYDKRVQVVKYNRDDVTKISVKEGVSTLIQLDKSEVLTTNNAGMGLGDPLAWNVSVRANNIFIRPIAKQPDTNVTLVTNKRTYILSLKTASSADNASWLVRFSYPENEVNEERTTPCSTSFMNWNYYKKGDKELSPLAIWDDGRFTCMRFSSSKDLPIVYRVMEDGKEAITNTHLERDVMVIHEISNNFMLRLGDRVMAIKTNSSIPQSYNDDGTTTGEKRAVINDF